MVVAERCSMGHAVRVRTAQPLPPPRSAFDVPLHTFLKWRWWPSPSSYLRTPFPTIEVLLAPPARRIVAMRPAGENGAPAVGWQVARAAARGSRASRNRAGQLVNQLLDQEAVAQEVEELVDRNGRPIDFLIVETRDQPEPRGRRLAAATCSSGTSKGLSPALMTRRTSTSAPPSA